MSERSSIGMSGEDSYAFVVHLAKAVLNINAQEGGELTLDVSPIEGGLSYNLHGLETTMASIDRILSAAQLELDFTQAAMAAILQPNPSQN